MEYVYFVITIAALGSLLGLYWKVCEARKQGRSLFSGHRDMGVNLEPPPPLKKVISGLSEKELEQIRFQEKVEIWQRGIGVRSAFQTPSGHQSLNGKKYTYEPPRKSRVEEQKVVPQSAGTSSNLHRWQLIG